MSIAVAIAGVGGRMGQALLTALAEHPSLRLSGASERPDSPLIGTEIAPGVRVSAHPQEAAAAAAVWVDFTPAEACLAALAALRNGSARAAIIGGTGFSSAQEDAVLAAGRDLALVRSGNFSLGVAVLAALVEDAARRLRDWDIEILDIHHNRKTDAPSGTALLLGDAAARGRAAALSTLRRDNAAGTRPKGSIGFAALRAGGFVGEHEVVFASDREALRLSHQGFDRSLFADGALEAAQWAAEKPPGVYTMRDVLGL